MELTGNLWAFLLVSKSSSQNLPDISKTDINIAQSHYSWWTVTTLPSKSRKDKVWDIFCSKMRNKLNGQLQNNLDKVFYYLISIFSFFVCFQGYSLYFIKKNF